MAGHLLPQGEKDRLHERFRQSPRSEICRNGGAVLLLLPLWEKVADKLLTRERQKRSWPDEG